MGIFCGVMICVCVELSVNVNSYINIKRPSVQRAQKTKLAVTVSHCALFYK